MQQQTYQNNQKKQRYKSLHTRTPCLWLKVIYKFNSKPPQKKKTTKKKTFNAAEKNCTKSAFYGTKRHIRRSENAFCHDLLVLISSETE